jgi:hypothetical protein
MSFFSKLEELILPRRCRQSERIRTTPDSRPDDLFFLAVVIPHGEMLFEAALRISEIGLLFFGDSIRRRTMLQPSVRNGTASEPALQRDVRRIADEKLRPRKDSPMHAEKGTPYP